MTNSQKAAFELILAAAIWGFGFVATIWALKEFSPTGLMVARYILAAFVGEAFRFLFLRRGAFFSYVDFKLSIVAGLLMAGFILPQTIGLLTTTAANSGFLTVLYVVFVPVFGRIFFRQRHSSRIYFHSLIALLGAWMMMGGALQDIKIGDLWTLMCAIFAAFHILYIGKINERIVDSFRFNSYQSFWCLLGLLAVIPFEKNFSISAIELKSWFGLLSLAFGSSVFGFLVQIRAQKVLSETTAAQFFLLESPFALFFGVAILGESLKVVQIFGAILILLASFAAIRADSKLSVQ